MDSNIIMQNMELELKASFQTTPKKATPQQLHMALSKAVMSAIADDWYQSRHRHMEHRRAYYFSAEFLTGRMIYNNLYSLGILDEMQARFQEQGIDLQCLEDIEDAALGNGGLGRLAACFLDSAATLDLPLDGYGIRYKYGLFKQSFDHGCQKEEADDWQRQGDPWGRRADNHIVTVSFSDMAVRAVPYDMPIIGYQTKNIGTLRLWQSEAIREFDFTRFNDQQFDEAMREKIAAENITNVLYPNDSTWEGKKLRLRQQYFLSSASLQDIIANFKRVHGSDFSCFADQIAIQLNDTHPVVSIPELVRLLMEEGLAFDDALAICQRVFSYTNHTIMSEALEKWDVGLFRELLPQVFDLIYRINAKFCGELMQKGFDRIHEISIIQENRIHMANLAIYGSHCVNGVAAIHTELIKHQVFSDWYTLYPDRFQNKTNGVTQRRWLGLCNPDYARFITERIGEGWIKDFSQIAGLRKYIDEESARRFHQIKYVNKQKLSKLVQDREGVELPPDFLFDVQVKRMHEYKRQLLNAFSIMDLYFGLKDGSIKDFFPTVFLFGAKAAPGYIRAKAIIKYINEVAKLVNNDPLVRKFIRVAFVSNYNCSYAEHIIPAADVSEQISPAGTEASGTGNMKLMINGAVTLGTYDGANIEIFEQAGLENNYVFGKRVEELDAIRTSYHPMSIYESQPRIKRVVDTLVDGTFSDEGLVSFQDLYRSLTTDGGYNRPDNYFILYELMDYAERKLTVNRDYRDTLAFSKKGLINTASSGKFSSDRTIAEYAREIWRI